MLNIFSLWSKKSVDKALAPLETFPEPTGEQLLYKMKYDGADQQENFHKGLHRLRVSIKRLAGESQIMKQELRHATRACRRLKNKRRNKETTTQYKPLYDNNATAYDIYELGIHLRHMFLAYGYLRKQPYKKIESHPRWRAETNFNPDRKEPDWGKVADLIFRHGNFNEFLLTPKELLKARIEQLDLLRKWIGN